MTDPKNALASYLELEAELKHVATTYGLTVNVMVNNLSVLKPYTRARVSTILGMQLKNIETIRNSRLPSNVSVIPLSRRYVDSK